jgi:serine/threonine-protein kinase
VSIGQGTRLGQYEVQDFIGQGAMGVVYRAYHAQLERTGAIKVMQAITPDPDTVARFRREAQAIAKLRHPNIVDVYDFGEHNGTPYMIVEYVPGGSLASRMEQGPLDKATALRYLRGIAAGLDYAHNHGVVHRDVKPANVLMTNDESPILADFGLAKLLEGTSMKSMTGVTTGTPAYMAPEQVTGQRVGPPADRYSLATIAYEMLTGVIPFDGQPLMELLYSQVHRMPPAASSRNPALSPEVDAVLSKGLAKDPAARWPSAGEFVEGLAEALTASPAKVLAETMVMATPVAAKHAVARTAVVAPPPPAFVEEETTVAYPSPPPPAATPKKSHRRRWIAGAAMAVILVLLLGLLAVVANATTIDINPKRTVPGGRVTVTATHVPAKQVGEIQLLSTLHTFLFWADADGNVSVEIVIPNDIQTGNHTVRICWSNTCHKQTQLRVVNEAAEATPTPVASPSPSPSPKPTPSHAPTPTPTQLSGRAATLTANPSTAHGNEAVSLKGGNFKPFTSVTIKYFAPSNSLLAYATVYGNVGSSGAFVTNITTKPASSPRTDRVVACDNGTPTRCAYAYISIVTA